MPGLMHMSARLRLLLLLAPGLGYLAVFFGLPLLWALVGSFQDETGGFTLLWYERIATRPSMLRGLSVSLYYGTTPVLVSLAIAVPLALALRRSFVGKKLFNGLYKLPLAVPGIITSLMIIIMLDGGGFAERLLAPLGIDLPKLVRDPWGVGVIVTTAWKQVPFMTLIITGAFAAIPQDLRLAGRAFGASRLKTFLLIEVPLAMPGISAAVLMSFIGSMGSYAVPDIVGPATGKPLSVLMVKEFNQGHFEQVYAIGMVLSLFAVGVLIAYYMLTQAVGQANQRGRHP